MKKEKGRTFDGITRPSNDTYRKNFDEIFGKKPIKKHLTGVRCPNVDLKGTVFCKAKKCSNHLYKFESSSLPGYCMDCG